MRQTRSSSDGALTPSGPVDGRSVALQDSAMVWTTVAVRVGMGMGERRLYISVVGSAEASEGCRSGPARYHPVNAQGRGRGRQRP